MIWFNNILGGYSLFSLVGLLSTVALAVPGSIPTDYKSSWRIEDCQGFASHQTLEPGVSIINATYTPTKALESQGIINKFPFCRLFAKADYEGNNSVIFEVWLPPKANYNDRILVIGNGGMAGVIPEYDMVKYINSGFAVAAGDGGHRASENNDGVGTVGVDIPYLHDVFQVKSWIRNSVATFTPHAKELTTSFYHRSFKKSYYFGCSTGGGQGFFLAKHYPSLFDGIIAACPGNYYSHLILSFLWNSQFLNGKDGLSQGTLDLVTKAALDKCDTNDGIKDGVIENPLDCDFDLTTIKCVDSASDKSKCLTAQQFAAVEKIYQGPVDSRTNNSVYPGFAFGSETQWSTQANLAEAFTVPILQNLVYKNLSWEGQSFDWGSDVDLVDTNAGTFIDMTSPDLTAFRDAGGKMIVLQSWADPFNAGVWPINHLREVERYNGGSVKDWFNLFMVPGGGHCGGASNYTQVPGDWHHVDALVEWVESGDLPHGILATTPADDSKRTRRLCPWPQAARFLGGNPDDWKSFKCEE